MFDNLRARIKLGIFIRVYPENTTVTKFFELILSKQWDTVYVGAFEATIKGDGFTLTFWVANKYYGYASDGTLNVAGETTAWDSCVPSTSVMYKMMKAIAYFQYNNVANKLEKQIVVNAKLL